eukprot:scaffold904_cov101-Isochrysis_galbana.AAC.2
MVPLISSAESEPARRQKPAAVAGRRAHSFFSPTAYHAHTASWLSLAAPTRLPPLPLQPPLLCPTLLPALLAPYPQEVEVLENPQKERRLLELLKKFKPTSTNRVLVFALYKKEAARVEQMLKGQGYKC